MGRFADMRPLYARILLGMLLLLCCYSVLVSVQHPAQAVIRTADPTQSDLALYQAVAARVADGESYYPAVVAEQRARDYPLRPVVTVRLPSLAWLVAAIGADTALHLLRLLALAAVTAFALRMRTAAPSKLVWAAASALAAAAMTLLTVPAMIFWHESWAALLIALSLACRSRERWVTSLLLGIAAVLIRELAVPYLAVMALFAWREGRRTEALAWLAAILIFFAALASHAVWLAGYLQESDQVSPGWARAGGWPLMLSFVQLSTLFAVFPLPLVGLLVPLAFLGWASVRTGMGERAALIVVGYAFAFMLVGRPDNFYWAILIAPLLPMGLAFAPGALRDLAIRASRRGDAPSRHPASRLS
jgi:hypothetical protein